MSTMTEKLGNVCIWCAGAAVLALAAITAGVLVWVGML